MFILVAALTIVGIFSMPYNVPLQGEVGGKRTLVLLDDLGKLSSYSLFFNDLSSRGHHLKYFHVESEDLVLKDYGDYLYDNILLLAPEAQRFKHISFDEILEFTQMGGNLMLAVDGTLSESMREFGENFGAIFEKSLLVDHMEYEPSLDLTFDHSTFLSKEVVDSAVIVGDYHGKAARNPILFNGIGHKLPSESVLSVPILKGNPTSLSSSSAARIQDLPTLVSGIQGRNNARIVISGSLQLFSNAYFTHHLSNLNSASGNRIFCSAISAWAFRETGIIRFRNIVHHKSDGSPPDVILHEKERPDLPISLYPDPEITRNSLVYRIKDEIIYSMLVEEFVGEKWQPFKANDMQMEFVMLDPYIRKTMKCDEFGNFYAKFTAPDNYGIFKFRVLYRRVGYSVIHAETQVSIRPFKHNEYERFILSAYPYYASAFSATIAFFIFSILFLFSG